MAAKARSLPRIPGKITQKPMISAKATSKSGRKTGSSMTGVRLSLNTGISTTSELIFCLKMGLKLSLSPIEKIPVELLCGLCGVCIELKSVAQKVKGPEKVQVVERNLNKSRGGFTRFVTS